MQISKPPRFEGDLSYTSKWRGLLKFQHFFYHCDQGYSFNSMGLFVENLSFTVFHWLFCIKLSVLYFHLWCMLRDSVWITMKSNLFRLNEAKLFRATRGMPKWVSPSADSYGMFFIQTSTLPPSMNRMKNVFSNLEGGACKTTTLRPKVELS